MTTLTPLQVLAFEAVKKWGEQQPWFRGVCMDNFPKDEEIAKNFDEAVATVCFETAMWDDPDFHTSF